MKTVDLITRNMAPFAPLISDKGASRPQYTEKMGSPFERYLTASHVFRTIDGGRSTFCHC